MLNNIRNSLNLIKNAIPYYHHYIFENARYKFSKNNNENLGSDNWNKSYKIFCNEGISILPLNLESITKYFDKKFDDELNILEKSNENELLNINSQQDWNDYGKKNLEININSKIFHNLIFDKNLLKFLNLAFKSNFWFRNHAVLSVDNEKYRKKNSTQGTYHIDNGLRQISIMILLNDIDQTNSHMEYIKGSHKDNYYSRVSRYNRKFIKKTKSYLNNDNIFKLNGKKGDAYIFNAGNGIHRAVFGKKVRKILHFNLVNNYAHLNFNTSIDNKEIKSKDFAAKLKENSIDKDIFRIVI